MKHETEDFISLEGPYNVNWQWLYLNMIQEAGYSVAWEGTDIFDSIQNHL